MNRVDTKFIFRKKCLPGIIVPLMGYYQVLQIGPDRLSTYQNLYFDTEDLQFYKDHHNGKKNRLKIRKRKYMETNTCFLEVKQKGNKGKTIKSRQFIQNFDPRFSQHSESFLQEFVPDVASLQPTLWNEFKRMTLVNNTSQERITIDTDLQSWAPEKSMDFADLVIAEVKQTVFDRDTPFFNVLKAKHINPYPFSKYCLGLAGLHGDLKQNAFKEHKLRIHKII